MIKEVYDATIIAKEALEDKKAEDIKALDLRGISNVADFFVIATGNNINQLRAMADSVEEKLKEIGFTLNHSEGYREGNWILLNFGNIVVHLFSKAEREFYTLERVWADGKEI